MADRMTFKPGFRCLQILLAVCLTVLLPGAAAATGSLYIHAESNAVHLRWNAPADRIYQGFHVERQARGGAWERLTSSPVVRIKETETIRQIMGSNAESFLTFFDPAATTITDAELARVRQDDFAGAMIGLFSVKFPAMGIILGERYMDDRLEPGGSFAYRVILIDGSGAESPWAEGSRRIVHGSEDELPVPQGFEGEGGESIVLLNWQHDSDASRSGRQVGYRIYRSTDPLAPFRLASPETVIPTLVDDKLPEYLYLDRLVSNGQAYWYYLTTVDVLGFESRPSEMIRVVPGDKTPPPVPQNFQGRLFNGNGQFTWTPVEADDLSGYRVFRSAELEGPYSPWPEADDAPAFGVIYTDESVAEGASYYYFVVSEDTAGNQSNPSTIVQLYREDTTPPAAPVNLQAVSDDDGIHLAWDANTEPDLEGYLVQRTLTITGKGEDATADASEFYAVNSTPLQATAYLDGISRFSEARYAYRVIAIDGANNESEPSEVVISRMPDITPPAPPAVSRIRNDPDGITLHWQEKLLDDLAGFRVYRRTEAESGKSGQFTAISGPDLLPASATSFTDRPDETDTTYAYTVSALDESGNESDWPEPVRILFLDRLPPALPEDVRAESTDDGLLLAWQAITDADLLVLKVFRYTGSPDDYSLIANLEDGQVEFLDTAVEQGETYHYLFRTMDKKGNRSELSPTFTATYETEE